jgi:hypothetical protein
VGVRLSEVTDGLSNTLMVGEKHVPVGQFGVGFLDSSAYNGDYPMCYTRGAGMGTGIAQTLDSPDWQYGSFHPAVCQFVMVDASVHAVSKNIDPNVLAVLAIRNDGLPTPDY